MAGSFHHGGGVCPKHAGRLLLAVLLCAVVCPACVHAQQLYGYDIDYDYMEVMTTVVTNSPCSVTVNATGSLLPVYYNDINGDNTVGSLLYGQLGAHRGFAWRCLGVGLERW